MAISARLRRKTEAALTRFCRARGITKTEAIERGIGLLLDQDRRGAHPAYVAYRQLTLVPEPVARGRRRSSDPMRTKLRAKHPD
jgi:hypothetical protein